MLTDKQWTEIYIANIETRKDIDWIKHTLETDKADIKNCELSLNELQIQSGYQKGKVASLAIGVTALFTIIVNGLLWTFSRFGGVK